MKYEKPFHYQIINLIVESIDYQSIRLNKRLKVLPGGDIRDTTKPSQIGCLSSKGHLCGGVWHETVWYPRRLCVTIQYLPVEVERLQQMYPVFSGGHTVQRNRLNHLRANRHASEHQQGSDGKPAPKPWMHANSKHLLLGNGEEFP